MYGEDFLESDDGRMYDVVVMNPPFKLFDAFVEKAKRIADEVWCIGKLNYFGAHGRNAGGLWNTLDTVYVFDRMIAFDIPEDSEGRVECGMMVTGWFYWKKSWTNLSSLFLFIMPFIKGISMHLDRITFPE